MQNLSQADEAESERDFSKNRRVFCAVVCATIYRTVFATVILFCRFNKLFNNCLELRFCLLCNVSISLDGLKHLLALSLHK